MNYNPKFLNLILLSGDLEEKIKAVKYSGFDQVEIWREDIQNYKYGPIRLAKFANEHKIKFTNVQVLRDFTGTLDNLKNKKREEFHEFIKIAKILGCNTIQAPATTSENCIHERIDDDLCWMALEAARNKMRIMYEPMAWCSIDNTLPLAWERLKRLNQPNIGLVVDLFHICALGGDASQLDGIPSNFIYEVQLCDMAKKPLKEKQSLIKMARHERLLPGDGIIKIDSFIDKLKNINYQGPIGIEVFNDQLKLLPPIEVAHKAWCSLNRFWP